MNWCIPTTFLVFLAAAYLDAEGVSFCELHSAIFSYDNSKNISLSNPLIDNLQYGWLTSEDHNQQTHGWSPSYCQQMPLASVCQSWNEAQFAHEIERSIKYCVAYGYSRQQTEACILEQHALYSCSNFIANIKKFDGYRSYIKKLHQKLLSNRGKFYRLRRALGCVNRGYVQLCDVIERLYHEIVAQENAEQVWSQAVSSRDSSTQQLQKPSSYQQNRSDEIVQKTFDEQRNTLEQALDEWQMLREMYQEEEFGNTTRIVRRIQALKIINDGHVVYTEQTYTLSTSAASLLRDVGSDGAQYNDPQKLDTRLRRK